MRRGRVEPFVRVLNKSAIAAGPLRRGLLAVSLSVSLSVPLSVPLAHSLSLVPMPAWASDDCDAPGGTLAVTQSGAADGGSSGMPDPAAEDRRRLLRAARHRRPGSQLQDQDRSGNPEGVEDQTERRPRQERTRTVILRGSRLRPEGRQPASPTPSTPERPLVQTPLDHLGRRQRTGHDPAAHAGTQPPGHADRAAQELRR